MRNSKFLERVRINTALSAVYDYPLMILEAPMGYGKTTAVKKFIDAEKLKPFWFTFSDLSNSEVAFWNKFTDEIIKIDAQAGLVLKSLGFPADAPQMEKVLLTLTNLVFEEKFFVVLDDYQLARDIRLNKLLLRLAQEELDDFHILLIARDTTNIDFVELLSKGLCHIISRQQLKFTEPEIRGYCRMMKNGITDGDLNKICEYTDGWISFIYIILLGLENGIPVGMNTTIEELVEKALFAPCDKQTQDFLLMISVMEDFTAKQAEFVTKNKNAQLLLKQLNRENAFVFYDEKTKTYKIHNVLLDYLRLKQNFSVEETCCLYSRLGDWYLEKQEFQTAYGYFYRAGQTERILAHLNNPQNIRSKLNTFAGVDEMFDSTSREMLLQYPVAYLLHIFYSIIQGKENAVLGWAERLDELQQHYEKLDGIAENYRNRILGETLIVRKFTVFNQFSQMTASDKEVVRLLNGQNSYITLREHLYTFGSPHYLYIYYRNIGSFKELADMLAGYVGYAEFSNGCGTGCDFLAKAEYALETGDFDNVERNSLQAIARAETMSQTCIIICAKFNLLRLRVVQGRFTEALELLKEMQRDAEKMNAQLFNIMADLCKGYIFASICQPERIPSWLQIGDMTAFNYYHHEIAYTHLVYGKTVMASKKYTKLEALTGQFKKYFSLFNNQLGFIHNQIFEAVAKCNLYGTSTGAAVLEAALNEARADQLVMPFVESAPHIMGMLQLIVQNNTGDEYVNRILVLGRKYERMIQSLSYHPVLLSQREISILELASEGLSRKEMAARLCISEETAKTHFKNIYQKLGVSSKVSAIKIAQDRGYLGAAEM